MFRKLLIILLGLLLFIPSASAQTVFWVKIEEPITISTLEFIQFALEKVQEEKAELLLITLDTPGGGLGETLKIVKLIQRSEIPVAVYVFPEGSTAWSAGTFILLSAHVTAMAPHSIIGSAQPVITTPQGIIPINETKIIRALTAVIKEQAKIHGRNETLATRFITENINLDTDQAKELNVIEFIAKDPQELLDLIHGFRVESLEKVLDTKDAELIEVGKPIKLQFLSIISNPMIAGLMLMVGIYSLIFGISSPGYGSEIAGVILISLGLIGSGFNLSIIAIFLIIFGAALLFVELTTPGFGILGVGGLIALAIGSIFLVPLSYPRWVFTEEFLRTAYLAIVVPTGIVATFFGFAFVKVMAIRGKKPVIGVMVGKKAVALEPISPKKFGFVRCEGEYWRAKSNQKISKGEEVIVKEQVGSILTVEKVGKK